MTKREAVREFKEEVLPLVVKEFGSTDVPARDQAWNDWTDDLCKGKRITQKQYDTWTHPFNDR